MSRKHSVVFLLLLSPIWLRAQQSVPSPVSQGPGTGSPVSATDANPAAKAPPQTPNGGTATNAPQYDKKQFEVLTGVGAVLAGVESTSYKIDTTNNALSQTDVGRKTVEILLGGGFNMPWHKGGGWIERSFCGSPDEEAASVRNGNSQSKDYGCRQNGDPDYREYRPWETFLSIRFAPGTDQAINGFVVGGGYRITKYFSLLTGYSVTPVDEPTHGFRAAASEVVAANPKIFPYNHFNASDLLNNAPGAFDGFPLFLYNANGVTTTKIFPTSPLVTHYRSGIYFGVGIPLNLTSLFKPSSSKE